MRLTVFCSLMMVLIGAFFAQTIPSADSTQYFDHGTLQIQRSLIVKQAGFVSSATGAALEKYESIVLIVVKNNGNVARTNLKLVEDLTYVPPNSKFTFNIDPKMNGNYAQWGIEKLEPSEAFSIRFSVPSIIAQSAFEKLPPPQMEYDRQYAVLEVSKESNLGSSISISLKGRDGKGIASAFVQVSYPGGEIKNVRTDASGNVRIIAQQIGVYSFTAPDYEIGEAKATKVVEGSVEPESPIKPDEDGKEPQKQEQTIDVAKMVFDLWYFALVPIALIFAYFGYKYMASPVEEQDYPVPPAPAKRPTIDDSALAERPEEQESSETGHQVEAGEQDTRSLIAKRRQNIQNPQEEQEPPQEHEEEETDEPEEEAKEEHEEESPIAHGDETEYKERMGQKEQDIDEDAIKKTIRELEQLREELKNKPTDEEESQEELDEEHSDSPIKSIVERAQDSERKKVINEDIGMLLEEDGEVPIVAPAKKRGRPKGTLKQVQKKGKVKKAVLQKPKAKKSSRGPGRPKKKR